MSNSTNILSLEAKDIYAAETLNRENPIGYNIRKQNGEINLSKFKNTLDWSLDSIKLQEEYYKATRKKNFFFLNGRKKFSQVVINVTFSYSFKEFNQMGQNTYVRAGYDFKDCEFKDGVCVKDGVLIGIQTNLEINNPVSQDYLGDYFSFINGCYVQTGNIPVLMNKSQLRQYLYSNGFVCDGIKYVRYKRSSGSSRVGKCLFVNEIVAKRMERWDRCGLSLKQGDAIDLAAWEAYISLPMSSIIDTLKIPVDSILVVDDADSIFTDEVVAVEEQDGHLIANIKNKEVCNTIWDGESLLDESMFGKYKDKGMLLLRNRFFKTCAFNTNLQKWFEDNCITDISQLNGFTLATDVSQIKLITTPSSIKYLKFGKIEQWLENIEDTFGVVKHEKETHFFGGDMVQCHYQLINTLDFKENEIKEFLSDSLEYIAAVRRDPDVLRYHIGYSFKSEEEENEINPFKNKNDIVFKLLGINDDFCRTRIYRDFRNSLVKGYIKNLKRGHILVEGNYSTLFGNGIELLKQSIGKFDGTSSIPAECIHSKRFSYDKILLGTRSPHICAGNILLVKNIENEEIDHYFNLTNEIVYINSINSNIFQKLNGADLDSDTILLTDNEILINVAKRREGDFKVPTNFVEAKKKKRYYDDENKTDLDVKTSVNKIGEIVNLSQLLNSLYWEKSNVGDTKDLDELYCDICKLAVLSNIEIDKAKKEFTIDSAKEIEILKNKYKLKENDKQVKPMFFKTITTENGYELSDKVIYRYFNTPMDYYQKEINSFNFRMSRKYKDDIIPFMDIVKHIDVTNRSGYYCHLRDKILDLMVEVKRVISQQYVGYEQLDKRGKDMVKEAVELTKREYMQVVDDLSENEYLMYIVLKEMDKEQYRPIHNIMFRILFGKPNETFVKMIIANKAKIHQLVEEKDGEIKLFSRSYSKKIA